MRVLGAPMDLVKPTEVFHYASERLKTGQRTVVANHNLHSLYLIRTTPEFRAFYDDADLIEVDSAPLLFWARLIGRNSRGFHRCTYLDWRDEFWSWAQDKGWRVFFVGGAPGIGEQAIRRINFEWPRVTIASHHGYFDAHPGGAENDAVVEQIRAFAPDILLVGMGMPRQEIWVQQNLDKLGACVVFTVGAAFDYEVGVQAKPPRWMGQAGLEWLYRLAADPRRLFRRYCVEPWHLVGPALRDLSEAFFVKRERRTDPVDPKFLAMRGAAPRIAQPLIPTDAEPTRAE